MMYFIFAARKHEIKKSIIIRALLKQVFIQKEIENLETILRYEYIYFRLYQIKFFYLQFESAIRIYNLQANVVIITMSW
jgi:hypothetical protein